MNLRNKAIQENSLQFIDVELSSLSETEQGERQKLEQIIKDQSMGFYPLGCAFKAAVPNSKCD